MNPSREKEDGLEQPPHIELLRSLWCSVLGEPEVDDGANFFEIGGDSVTAVSIAQQFQEQTGITLEVDDVFAADDLAALARTAEKAPRVEDRDALVVETVDRTYPVRAGLGQEWQYLTAEAQADRANFTVSLCYRVRGPLDVERLRGALRLLSERHEILRTGFQRTGETVYQQVSEDVVLDAEVVRLPDGEPGTVRAAIREHTERPIDRSTAPLGRCVVLRVSPQEHVVLLVLDHMICDASSLGILVTELTEFYRELGENPGLRPPALTHQFMDWSAHQRRMLSGERLNRLADYWAVALGPDHRALATEFHDYTDPKEERSEQTVRVLGPELGERLREAARQDRATPHSVILAGLVHALSGRVSNKRLVVHSTLANREAPETAGVLGGMAHDVHLPIGLEPGEDPRSLVFRVQQATEDMIAHGAVPNTMLWDLLWPAASDELVDVPIFYFTHVGGAEDRLRFEGTETELVSPEPPLAMPGLECSSSMTEHGVYLEGRHLAGSFPEGYVDSLFDDTEAFFDAYLEGR